MKTTINKLFVILLVCIASSITLFAQSNTTLKDTAKGKEVVVTGLRYPEYLIELPMSVSILKGNDLLFNRGYGVDEVLNKVPGVLAQSRAGATDIRLTIRGFGARGAGNRSNSGTSRGIKILLDGMPLTEPDGRTSFDLIDFDVASKVEIIRSNLSSIWGNAAGGIVNISTIPLFTKDYVQLDLQGGSYGYQKYGLQAAAKLETGVAYLQVSNTKYDGFRQNSDGERLFINAGLTTALSNKTVFDVHLTATHNQFNIPGPLSQSEFDTSFTKSNPTYLTQKERRNNTLGRLGLNLTHNFNDNNVFQMTTFVEPKYLERSERNTYRNFLRYNIGANANYKNISKITDEITNIALVGIDEQYQDGGIMFFTLSSNGGRGDLKTNKREGANTMGTYFQDEIKYNNLSVMLGGRYDVVNYYSVTYFDDAAIVKQGLENKIFSKFTPRFGLNYLLNENNSLFASYGGGIEVPAGNETDPNLLDVGKNTNTLLEPIISTTMELGWKLFMPKADWYNNMELTISTFNIDVKNELAPYSGGKFYLAAAKTNRKGVELGINLVTEFGLKFNTAFTLMSTKYNEYKIDSLYIDTSKVGKTADYSNNKIAGIPGYNFNISIGYVVKALNNLEVMATINGVSKYYVDDANKVEVPAFNVIGLRLQTGTLLNISDNMPLSLYANLNNLTDVKYASSAFINPDYPGYAGGKPVFLEPGMPRNFMIGLRIKFQ